MNDIAPTRFKWVGTRPIRPDGVPKVTGRAMYGADFATAGTLYGKVIRSPHAHARIRSIDTSKAEALPGVKAVVTAKDFPDHKFEYIGPERVAQNFWHITRNVMAREKALYEGHAVAAVAAISKSVVDKEFKTAAVHQAYIEPHACVARFDHDGQAEIWASSQGHFVIRALTAKLLDMPVGNIRVTPAEIGGGFGGKTVVYLEPVATLLAKKA